MNKQFKNDVSQEAYIRPTSNNMFTLRVLAGTSIGQVRPHHFTGCDHRQDGLVIVGPVQRRREQRDVISHRDYVESFLGLIENKRLK